YMQVSSLTSEDSAVY
nr:immunoglobulin heavy chain junction region [Mus musculus]